METGPRPYEEIFTDAYRGRRVLVTGHNGFVGSWLSLWLGRLGAEVVGFSLPREHLSGPVAQLAPWVTEREGDVRDYDSVVATVRAHRPELVFHLAAQAFVLASYADPLATLATNVMGTAHLLDALHHQPSVTGCVVVTSDKCYATAEGPHLETDPLGGNDPYSASKAAAELVAHTYRHSFSADGPVIATARAGNIVGGGDWATGRVVPDTIQALGSRVPLELRHPSAVRPWQHVLDAVAGYLLLGAGMTTDPERCADAWNFGPPSEDAATVGRVVAITERSWRQRAGEGLVRLESPATPSGPERELLLLDSHKAETELGWRRHLALEAALDWGVEWYWGALRGQHFDPAGAVAEQVDRYLALDVLATAPTVALTGAGA